MAERLLGSASGILMLGVCKAHVQGAGRQVGVKGPQCLERASGEVRVMYKRRGGRDRAS